MNTTTANSKALVAAVTVSVVISVYVLTAIVLTVAEAVGVVTGTLVGACTFPAVLLPALVLLHAPRGSWSRQTCALVVAISPFALFGAEATMSLV